MRGPKREPGWIAVPACLLAGAALVCWSVVRLWQPHRTQTTLYFKLWLGAVFFVCVGMAWLRRIRTQSPAPGAGFFVGALLLSCGAALAASVAQAQFTARHAALSAWHGTIVTAGAVLLLLGAAILWRAPQARLRVFVFALVPLVLFGMLAELGLRAWTATYRSRAKAYDLRTYAGWTAQPYQNRTQNLPGFGTVHFTTTRDGFRVFGDPATTRTKILAVGDSFTEAHSVSDGKAYYHTIADGCGNVELFAFGTGAYGTLQEYMVIDRFWDEIRPNLLILQMTENDLTDNDYELQCTAPLKSYKVRPYYVDGKIRWLFPSRARDPWGVMVGHSYLLQSLDRRLTSLKASAQGFTPYPMSMDDPMVRRACDTTSQILHLISRRCTPTPIVAFCAYDMYGLGRDFKGMCESNGIYFVPGVYDAVEKARVEGIVVDGRPHDYHWNETGHRIAGEYVLDYLRRERLVCGPDPATTAAVQRNK